MPATEVTLALGIGVTLFVASSAFALWRVSRELLVPRLVILVVTVAVPALVSSRGAAWQLGVVALGLGAIAGVEGRRRPWAPSA